MSGPEEEVIRSAIKKRGIFDRGCKRERERDG